MNVLDYSYIVQEKKKKKPSAFFDFFLFFFCNLYPQILTFLTKVKAHRWLLNILPHIRKMPVLPSKLIKSNRIVPWEEYLANPVNIEHCRCAK